jgi:hypothetical protein
MESVREAPMHKGRAAGGKSSLMRYLLDEEKVRDTNALGF